MSSRIELAVASLRTAASNKALNAILDVIAAVQAFDDDTDMDKYKRVGQVFAHDMSTFYKSCAPRALGLASAVFQYIVETRTVPAFRESASVEKAVSVLRGILIGAIHHGEVKPGDREIIGRNLLKPVLDLLAAPGAARLDTRLLREVSDLLEDTTGDGTNLKALLQKSDVLSGARFAKILANHDNYFFIRSLLDFLPRVLPLSGNVKKRQAYVKDLFNALVSMKSCDPNRCEVMMQTVSKASHENWAEVVRAMVCAIAECDAAKPQPLAVSDVSVNGDQMTVLDDTLYLQTDTFSACVPESEIMYNDFEADSVASIYYKPLKGNDGVAISVGLNTAPRVSTEPMLTSKGSAPTTSTPFTLCFSIKSADLKGFLHLVKLCDMPCVAQESDSPPASQKVSLAQGPAFSQPRMSVEEFARRRDVQLRMLRTSSPEPPRKKVSIGPGVAIRTIVSRQELAKRNRLAAEPYNMSSPSHEKEAPKTVFGTAQDNATTARPESVLSQVDEDAAATAFAYAESLRAPAPLPSSPLGPQSPSSASRKSVKAVKIAAPGLDKDKDKEPATRGARDKENEKPAKAPPAAGKKRKASDRDENENEEPPAAKRAREPSSPARPQPQFGSQFLEPSSSPARTKYKSAKKRKPSPVSLVETDDTVVNFDEIPQSTDAEPEAKIKKQGKKAKAKAGIVKSVVEKDDSVGRSTRSGTGAPTAGAAKAKTVPAPEKQPARPNVKEKMKPKVKVKTDAKTTTRDREQAPAIVDDPAPIQPKSQRGKRGAPQIAQDDDDDRHNATDMPSKEIEVPALTEKTAAVIAGVDEGLSRSTSTAAALPRDAADELTTVLPEPSAVIFPNFDIEMNDDFDRFINLSPVTAPILASPSVLTSTPVRRADIPTVLPPATRAKKSNKAPWELFQSDARQATTVGNAKALLAAAPASSTRTASPSVRRADAPASTSLDVATSVVASAPTHLAVRASSVAPCQPPTSTSAIEPRIGVSNLLSPTPTLGNFSPPNVPTVSVPASAPVHAPVLIEPLRTGSAVLSASPEQQMRVDQNASTSQLTRTPTHAPPRLRSPLQRNELLANPGPRPVQPEPAAPERLPSTPPATSGSRMIRTGPVNISVETENAEDAYDVAVKAFMREIPVPQKPKAAARASPVHQKLQSAMKGTLLTKTTNKRHTVTFAPEPSTASFAAAPSPRSPVPPHTRPETSPLASTHRAATKSIGKSKAAPKPSRLPENDDDDEEEQQDGDPYLHKILSTMNKMNEIIASRITTNFAAIDRGPGEKARQLLQITVDDLTEMREGSVAHYNKFIDLEEEYAEFSKSYAQKLQEVVKIDRELKRVIERTIQAHDEGTLVKRWPISLFPGPVPAVFET